MKIVETDELTAVQKAQVMRLWNNEYPSQLHYDSVGGLDSYLSSLPEPHHLLAVDNDNLAGWAFSFERNGSRWFAIIVDGKTQGKGLGTTLLNMLKQDEIMLNGWVTDHDRYTKANGENYASPLGFYLKNDFTVRADVRLETEALSAVKIVWTKVN